jgi:hypothetical protein
VVSSSRHRGRRFEFWLSEEQLAKLREAAREDWPTSTGRSLSSIFREALDDWLDEHGKDRLFDRRVTASPVDVDRRSALAGRRVYERRTLTPAIQKLLDESEARRRLDRIVRGEDA